MKLSVIVPAFNEEKLIAETVANLMAGLQPLAAGGWSWELIVCDNNSTDATARLARGGGAQVVFEPVNQIGRARNTGAAAATGDWLLFVDADSRPTPALLADAAAQMQSSRCLGGGSTIRLDERHVWADLATSGWNIFSRVRKWVAGSFIFCRRDAFVAIGGFDKNLYASEEIDLSKKLKKLASKQGQKMVILHRHPMQTSARKMHLYSKGELLTFVRKAILQPRRTVTNREACRPWYDGRR